MKSTIAALLIILLSASIAIGEKPKTVDEAVQVLKTKWLKPQDREWILRNSKIDVWARLYRGFGTGMRNEFGLWETISLSTNRVARKTRRAVQA
jgi:hypothetical protein